MGFSQDASPTPDTNSSSSTFQRRQNGDCYDRAVVRVEEMRQSLRIIEQCVNNMPDGPYKSDHPLATPPVKDRTMHDIETLITHFLSVSWGPVHAAGRSAGRH